MSAFNVNDIREALQRADVKITFDYALFQGEHCVALHIDGPSPRSKPVRVGRLLGPKGSSRADLLRLLAEILDG